MKALFLGTGAADWSSPDANGEYRRLTSTLLDGRLLIDVTGTVRDMIPDACAISDVFFTHSHRDHFDPDALNALAPCRVWAHESWAGEIEGPGLTVMPLRVGGSVSAAGFKITPLPSNHSTPREYETTLHYLIEKDGKRLLYAHDTDLFTPEDMEFLCGKRLDLVSLDCTNGYLLSRWVGHMSAADDLLMRDRLTAQRSADSNTVFVANHFSHNGYPGEEKLKELLPGFVIARDGLEVEF